MDKYKKKDIDININNYINITKEFSSPIHLYMDKTLTYFLIYTIGKEKIIAWGIYKNDKFIFSDGCKYKLNFLNNYISSWNENDFYILGLAVKNRINSRLNSFLNNKQYIKNYKEYKELFLWYSIKKNKLDKKLKKYLTNNIQNILSRFDIYNDLNNIILNLTTYQLIYDDYQLNQYYDKIKELKVLLLKNVKKQLDIYEKNINLIEIIKHSDILNNFYKKIKNINFKFINDCETDKLKCDKSDIFSNPKCKVFFHGRFDYIDNYTTDDIDEENLF